MTAALKRTCVAILPNLSRPGRGRLPESSEAGHLSAAPMAASRWRRAPVFPGNDPHWILALAKTRKFLGARSIDRVFAPIEFLDLLGPAASSVVESYLEPPGERDLLVVHKGQPDQWSQHALDGLGRFRCLWADPVFAIYAHRRRWILPELHTRRHMPDRQLLVPATVEPPEPARVLLISAGGMGNLGDDAVTQCAAEIIRSARSDVVIERRSPPLTRSEVARASCIVLGGGGVLYDSCPFNLQNYSIPLLMAAELERPAICLGIGTQGIRTNLGRRLLGRALSHCLWVSVRDPGDARIVRDIAPAAKVYIDQDLAFRAGRRHRSRRFDHARPTRIGVSWVDSRRLLATIRMREYQRVIEDTVALAPAGASVELVVQSRDDLPMYREWQEQHGCRIRDFGGQPIEQVLDYYAELDLVLTSRYHGFIFALITGRPVICAGNLHGKIDRLIRSAVPSAAPCFIPLRQFDRRALQRSLALFTRDPSALRPCASEVDACIARAQALDERFARQSPL